MVAGDLLRHPADGRSEFVFGENDRFDVLRRDQRGTHPRSFDPEGLRASTSIETPALMKCRPAAVFERPDGGFEPLERHVAQTRLLREFFPQVRAQDAAPGDGQFVADDPRAARDRRVEVRKAEAEIGERRPDGVARVAPVGVGRIEGVRQMLRRAEGRQLGAFDFEQRTEQRRPLAERASRTHSGEPSGARPAEERKEDRLRLVLGVMRRDDAARAGFQRERLETPVAPFAERLLARGRPRCEARATDGDAEHGPERQDDRLVLPCARPHRVIDVPEDEPRPRPAAQAVRISEASAALSGPPETAANSVSPRSGATSRATMPSRRRSGRTPLTGGRRGRVRAWTPAP